MRIGAYSLERENAVEIVKNATTTGVFGIEVDNDIPGRYESFLDSKEKLAAIRQAVLRTHQAGNHVFVYIAGTECITAHADTAVHSLFKDHPDWVQRKVTGEPAVFTSGAAFWISPGDEDVWISPYAIEWRIKYMQRVRQIAATGIDGIYVDIPYWMTHFEGWEDSWASFDNYTIDAFRKRTGLDARKDVKIGNFSDVGFRAWLDFRKETLTDFVREIRENARDVKPDIVVIPEIYPGIEEEVPRVGADVYEMYRVADAIAHEYEFGPGEHMASSRSQLDWFLYQAGMLTFRAFAEGKPTWILNYSWDGDKAVDAREAMKNLAASEVVAGANFWDAPGHSMAGSNDQITRKQIFDWIKANEAELYSPRLPIQPVGVYFSPKSRDYDAPAFLPSYRGTLVMLLQAHREFQVVTPRTLSMFNERILLLPNVTILTTPEKQELTRFVQRGGRLLVTGRDMTGLSAGEGILRFPNCPGANYLRGLEKDSSGALTGVPAEFLAALGPNEIDVTAPPTVAMNFGRVNGKPHAFLVNFGGLVPRTVASPTPVHGIRVSVPASMGDVMTFLPFLGKQQMVQGVRQKDREEFLLPTLERAAVISISTRE